MGPILTFFQGYPGKTTFNKSSYFPQYFALPSYKFPYASGFTSRSFSSFPLVFLFISLNPWTKFNFGRLVVYLVGIVPSHCSTFLWVSLQFLHVYFSCEFQNQFVELQKTNFDFIGITLKFRKSRLSLWYCF